MAKSAALYRTVIIASLGQLEVDGRMNEVAGQ
jgi:hypothetical protein